MDFVTHNFKDMGISINSSLELYRDAVVKAGGSTAGLTTQISSLRETASKTQASLGDMQKNFQAGVGTMSGMGAGSNSAVAAGIMAQQFANVPDLAGVNLSNIITTQMGQTRLAQALGTNVRQLPGVLHGMQGAGVKGGVAIAAGVTDAVKTSLIRLGLRDGMSEQEIWDSATVNHMLQIFQQYGLNITDPQQAVTFAFHILNPNEKGTSAQDVLNRTKADAVTHNTGVGAHNLGAAAHAVKAAAAFNLDIFHDAASATRANLQGKYYGALEVGANEKNKMLEDWFNSSTNFRNIIVKDKSGKLIPMQDFVSKGGAQALRELGAGQVQVGQKTKGKNTLMAGSQWETAAEMTQNEGAALAQDNAAGTLGLTPEAARLVQLLPSGSNTMYNNTIQGQANQGTVNRNSIIGTGK